VRQKFTFVAGTIWVVRGLDVDSPGGIADTPGLPGISHLLSEVFVLPCHPLLRFLLFVHCRT
jgi:hypothetical protein